MTDIVHDTAVANYSFSPAVAKIFESLLAAINDGRLLPGERINDAALADQFEVSRTPVREALQRLRNIGLIEAAPNRFTRVALVSPEETAQAMIVWAALYAALVREVVPHAPPTVADAMREDHDAFLRRLRTRDFLSIATANFAFFHHLTTLTGNGALRRGIESVVHLIRLGSLHLPKSIDVETLARAQSDLLTAVQARDAVAAEASIRLVRNIEVPLQ
ncbi:MAG: hypothetical protein JWP30_487 [Homoserinimonas sp.]|jgi:DNA-binding GntR family transcriptional regulator|nr:hypothetical protein [Homoserinimonas sp.]